MKNNFTIHEEGDVKRIDYFDEHWYKIPGVEDPLPSVTSVIGSGSPKDHGFYQWLRDTGNESKVILREASESGSRIHNAIENILLGNEVSAEDGKYPIYEWKKINKWFDWWQTLGVPDVKSVEFIVYSEQWGVAGTVDLLVEIDGKKVMIDWKTGKSIHASAYEQISAYYYMAKAHGIEVDEAWVVHVGAKNKAMIKVHEVDTEKYIKHFELSLDRYKIDNPNKKAPTTEYPLTLQL